VRVLVTDAGAAAAVAVVRSLGRRGVTCVAGWHAASFPLAATSRFCAGVERLPDPMSQPDRYAAELVERVRRGDFDAVIPVSDAALAAAGPVRERIAEHAFYCAAPEVAMRAAEDKWGILQAANGIGLTTPPARLVEDREAARAALVELPPPWVIRARRSLVRDGSRFRQPAALVAFQTELAASALAERIDRGEPVVVSSYREGTGRGVYVFMADATPAAWFGHLRLRETDPRGSPACAAVPLIPSEAEVARCAALLSRLGVTGAAMVEFRRGRTDDSDALVEINPRLWGSISLAVHAGMDFPWWQLRYFTTGEVPVMPSRLHDLVGCRYLTAEIGHLINVARGAPPDWKGPFPELGDAWRGFAAACAPGWRYYHQSFEDPLPGVAEPFAFVHGRLKRAR
jgi:predicted ATP-grasp superfamily ATP-dependent carboligase